MKKHGKILFNIIYHENVIASDIPNLSKVIAMQIREAITKKLMINPEVFGKPLQHQYKGYWRLRVGDYRVIYRIDSVGKIIYISAIKHRKDAYWH